MTLVAPPVVPSDLDNPGGWVAVREKSERGEDGVVATAHGFTELVADEQVEPSDTVKYALGLEPKPAELGEKLRRARKLRRLTLRAVAERADLSATYLNKLEKGQVATPSPRVLYPLAQVLDLSYAALLGLAGYPLPDPEEVMAAVSSPSDATDGDTIAAGYARTPALA